MASKEESSLAPLPQSVDSTILDEKSSAARDSAFATVSVFAGGVELSVTVTPSASERVGAKLESCREASPPAGATCTSSTRRFFVRAFMCRPMDRVDSAWYRTPPSVLVLHKCFVNQSINQSISVYCDGGICARGDETA